MRVTLNQSEQRGLKMQYQNDNRVLGRVMARDLTEREAENVGGADGGSGGFGCPRGTFLSGTNSDGTPACDPAGQRRSP